MANVCAMSDYRSKMHHRVMHALPFVPSRKRQKGFEIERHYGDWSLKMEAFETLNHYDLITLLLIAREYLRGNFEELGYKDGDTRKRVRIRLDIVRLVKERGLHNQRTNRMSLIRSLERFHSCKFEVRQNGEITKSWVISDMRWDDEQGRWAEIDCNERFLSWCAKGILVNWKRLSDYGNNGNAVLLDAYLQGTKQRKGGRWMYRNWIDADTAINIIDPHGQLPRKEAMRQLREAFAMMQRHGMPRYEYDRVYQRWVRQDEMRSEV